MLVVKLFPNGEFTHGVSSPRKEKKRSAEKKKRAFCSIDTPMAVSMAQKCLRDFPKGEYREPGTVYIDKSGVLREVIAAEPGYTVFLNTYPDGTSKVKGYYWDILAIICLDKLEPYIGLSVAPIFWKVKEAPRTRARKGSKGMSSHTGRQIRNGAFYLEQKFGRTNLSFLTLTLPALPAESQECIFLSWGKIVDRMVDWLAYALETPRKEFCYVYCTEIQSKRASQQGGLPLHLHILFPGRKTRNSAWKVSALRIRGAWNDIIRSFIPDAPWSDSVENIRQVRKNAGGYLSKYMSKGVGSDLQPDTQRLLQTHGLHWGGMARKVGRWIRKNTSRAEASSKADAASIFVRVVRVLDKSKLVSYSERLIVLRPASDGIPERGLKCGVGRIKKALALGAPGRIALFIANLASGKYDYCLNASCIKKYKEVLDNRHDS